MTRTEIVGRDEDVGSDLLSTLSRGARRVTTLPVDGTEKILRRSSGIARPSFVGTRTEIVGADDFGSDLVKAASRSLKKIVTAPIDLAEWAVRHAPSPIPSRSWFIGERTEIVGDEDCGFSEEELELAREGGSPERRAAERRLSSSGYNGKWKFSRGTSDVGRLHHQRRILRRLSRNPFRLAQVQQRASQGDVRAQNLLSRYQAMTSQSSPQGTAAPYASPWGTSTSTYPSAYPTSTPQATSYPTANVYYPAPSSYNDSSPYDDYSGDDAKSKTVADLAAVIKPALQRKKISRAELARAAAVSAGPGATNASVNTARDRISSFLARHGVKVE